MSAKMACPGCDSYTSSVLQAVEEGDPCPVCGLSAAAIQEIAAIRRRGADAEVTAKCEAALIRAERAEAETHELREIVRRVREAVRER